ncbi:hypothetical protein C8Q78DRAFT_1080358 [Trametes maxima]|nr:hypothetical protein C8Q78DRAFT_1080358 [Trametes maxima]
MVTLPKPAVPPRRSQRLRELDPATRRWRNVELVQTRRYPHPAAQPAPLYSAPDISVLFPAQTIGYILLPILGYALGPRATVLLFLSTLVATAWSCCGASGSANPDAPEDYTPRYDSDGALRLCPAVSSAREAEPSAGETAVNKARYLALGLLLALCFSNSTMDSLLAVLTSLSSILGGPSRVLAALLALTIMLSAGLLRLSRPPSAKEVPRVCEEEIQYIPEPLPPHGMRCSPRLIPS